MGGHCLPVDPFYLSWRAREFDMTTEFIELAGKVNQQMPYHCVAKAQRALNDARPAGQRRAGRGARRQLQAGRRRRARVAGAEDHLAAARRSAPRSRYHDPHVPELARVRPASAPLEQALADADLALIVTAHPSVDHELIATRARLVVDLRGVTRSRGARRERRAAVSAGAGARRRRRARRRARAAARRGRADRRGRVVRRLRGRARRHRRSATAA